MVLRSSLVVALLMGFFLVKNNIQEPINKDKEALILNSIIQTINYVHISPKNIDNDLSKEVYKNFLERVDGGKRYFIKSEIDQISKYEMGIDEQINERKFTFFDETTSLLDLGIARAERLYKEVINENFDLESAGLLQTNSEKLDWAKDENDLKQRWKNFIQWELVDRLASGNSISEDEEEVNESDQKVVTKEEALLTIKKKYDGMFERIKKLRRSDRLDTYFGCITEYFDPHTNYFSPKEKQDFDINMGGKLEGIGARLQTEGEYTKVSSIVVGGPAWKNKQLEENDIILRVKQEKGEALDIVGMRVDDVVQYVRGKKGTKVTLTVKKKDNSIVDITIERDEVQLEDSKVKTLILDVENKISNVGYIYLPKFYNSFDDGGNSCAFDVKQEILKLKKENVTGIILDLRNNSGGSLNDVVDMSGFFIEDGPIVQVKGRDKPFVHVDKDKSVLYDGPLIIMVNQFSASASEIIAAAMQDYERAIIVGSNSTFGKGTVQRFFDLDRTVRDNEQNKPLGSLKATTQKFYRINGGSTQLKGVVPDVILPDFYHFIDTGEKEYNHPLSWSEIDAVPFKQNVVLLQNKKRLIENSNQRINNHEQFQLILENAKMIKKNRENSEVPLKLNDYRAMVNQKEADSKKFKNIFKTEIDHFIVRNVQADMQKINLDDANIEKNKNFINDIKKDIQLEEAMYIMYDMITLEKSFATQQKMLNSN